jgi:hypothetical protein
MAQPFQLLRRAITGLAGAAARPELRRAAKARPEAVLQLQRMFHHRRGDAVPPYGWGKFMFVVRKAIDRALYSRVAIFPSRARSCDAGLTMPMWHEV